MISQEKATVEQYIKREDGNWIYRETIGTDGALIFYSLKAALGLKHIYDLVEFEEENL